MSRKPPVRSSVPPPLPTDKRLPLTRARVLATALEIVDVDGLDKLSMRRLGAALGVDPMAVYYYVPNKAALLDGLIEAVMTELGTPCDREPGTDLTDWVVITFGSFWDTLCAHPNVLPIMDSRMISGEAGMLSAEKVLAELRSAGVGDSAAIQVLMVLTTITIALARTWASRMELSGSAELSKQMNERFADLDPERFPMVLAGLALGPIKDWRATLYFTLRSLVAGILAGDLPQKELPTVVPEYDKRRQ
jgi:TetR/AcrR family transcriptional regulator, tetracycline repressor protein